MEPFFSEPVIKKLAEKHGVTVAEVIECFANRRGKSLYDTREGHKTIPPTMWFIAETDYGRKLKVVYVPTPNGPEIKTAYPANGMELEIYAAVAKVNF